MNEIYLEGTTDWILPKPLLIGEQNEYKFYIGTQIGNMGTSLVCKNCRSAIKYYWPESDVERQRLQKILKMATCPLCKERVDTADKPSEILNMMSMAANKFKARIT